MKKLLLALTLALAPSLAFGQCTGVFPAGSVCGNSTASASTPRAVNSIGVNPTPNTNNQGINILQSGPTSGSVAGPVNLNLITISSYNAATNAGSKFGDFGWWTSAITGFRVNFNIGGANLGATEPFAGIAGHMRFTVSSPVTLGTDMEGVMGMAYANASSSNTLAMEGVVGAAVTDTGGNVLVQVGVFAESDVLGTGVVQERRGLAVVSEGTGTATGHDAGIDFSASGGAFKTLISINVLGGGTLSPVQATGNFLDATAAFTVANFITLPTMTVTGDIFNFAKHRVRGTDGFTTIGSNLTPDSLLTINSNAAVAPVAPPATTNLHIVGGDGTSPYITLDSYNAGVIGTVIQGRYARGTTALPTATIGGDFIFTIGAAGYQGAGVYGAGTPQMTFTAAENFSAGHNGSYILFSTVPVASTTVTGAMWIQASGGVSVGSATDPGIGVIAASKGVQTAVLTVATLPTCNAAGEGTRAYVSDQATAVAYRGAVTGGGTTRQAVLCSNLAWIQD